MTEDFTKNFIARMLELVGLPPCSDVEKARRQLKKTIMSDPALEARLDELAMQAVDDVYYANSHDSSYIWGSLNSEKIDKEVDLLAGEAKIQSARIYKQSMSEIDIQVNPRSQRSDPEVRGEQTRSLNNNMMIEKINQVVDEL